MNNILVSSGRFRLGRGSARDSLRGLLRADSSRSFSRSEAYALLLKILASEIVAPGNVMAHREAIHINGW
jgi:hypothetical protein